MQTIAWCRRLLVFLTATGFILGIGVSTLTMTGCWWDEDEDECLVSGENCSSQYKEDNYGTTQIYCCSGRTCVTRSSGILVCP